MSYWNAIKLSFTNIMTKKGRTILTAFASSIGIISIAIVLAISNGFQKQINTTMSKALAKYPITITQTATDMTSMNERNDSDKNVKNRGYIIAQNDQSQQTQHTNKITQKYVDYIKKINHSYANNISYQRAVNLNLLSKVNGKTERVQFSNADPNQGSSVLQARAQAMSSMGIGSSVFPTTLNKNKGSFLKQNYQLLSGAWPTKATDLVLVADNKNTVNINSLKNLGFDVSNKEQIKFDKLVGKNFKLVSNNEYYQELPNGMFVPRNVNNSMYNNAKTKLKLVGVIRPKNEDSMDANPTNASIMPIINSLNTRLKLVATAESWLTGTLCFWAPSGINARTEFGIFKLKKFFSVEISPFK